jgi:hypothetical protein
MLELEKIRGYLYPNSEIRKKFILFHPKKQLFSSINDIPDLLACFNNSVFEIYKSKASEQSNLAFTLVEKIFARQGKIFCFLSILANFDI